MRRFATALGAAIMLGASGAAPALAQYAVSDNVTMYTGGTSGLVGPDTNHTLLDLGATPGTGFLPMPMSIAYGDTSIALSLQATGAAHLGMNAGLMGIDNIYNPTYGVQNALWVHNADLTLTFANAQNYFAAQWTLVGNEDALRFYSGETLLGQLTGAQLMSLTGTTGETQEVEFQFSELGYDRIVVSAYNSGMEIGGLVVAEAVDVAPAPLGSVGGLIAFLGMMGARRRGLTWKQALGEANPFRRAPKAQAA